MPIFDSGRRKTVVLNYRSSPGAMPLTYVFDEQLDPLGAFCCSGLNASAPDDRDGDGTLDVLVQVWNDNSPPDVSFALFRLGTDANSLTAVVRWPTIATAPMAVPEPTWMKGAQDNRHSLDWIHYGAWTASGPSTFTSVLKMHWLSPGCMALNGTPPPGVQVWLAKQRDELIFRQDEPLADVVDRVLPR